MSSFFRIDSISQLHEMIGYEKPKHPLISLIEQHKIRLSMPVMNLQFSIGLYAIILKNGTECQIQYSRQNYDFQEGTLIFLAPDQVIKPIEPSSQDLKWGWTLVFHPDLIRRSALGKKMSEYSFFSYDSHEALHLSEQERETVTGLVESVRHEYSQNLDSYSQELIVSNLELLLNYCKRFYGRQFITRTSACRDVVARFEEYLNDYFESGKPETEGLPNVKLCAKAMGYSPGYLSDLLKKETGRNTLEHIYYALINRAKTMLIGTDDPVGRIASVLGFQYPQHFSKLFKSKTGVSLNNPGYIAPRFRS
ncbi:MAG: AraC family transcriptional regulator [Dehalococcoidales bacterium]|nr:AraC family transcriptional regulator [Dehalococcoidales bacterium]